MTRSIQLTLLSLTILLLSTQSLVEGKLVECKSRFTKKMSHDYCTKFGTAPQSMMDVDVRSTLVNSRSLTVTGGAEHFYIEIAVIADQNYEKLMANEKATCQDFRKAASVLLQTVIPTDGSDSVEYRHTDNNKTNRLFTQKRPRMYYFEVLDCNGSIRSTYKTGQIPRLMHEIHMTTQDRTNEFSYEDQGLLRLCMLLTVLLGALFGLMIKTFNKFYAAEKSCAAPHPIMIFALFCQVLALTMQAIHLWCYSYDGVGLIVCDVLSKVIQGVSEVSMGILLIMLASGWKLRYQDIDFDDSLEIYLPMTVLVLMVQIILVALTFVDVDASHKYHDFAGVQGWCLLGLKTVLFLYFGYCIWDAKTLSKKKMEQDYLRSLLVLGGCYFLAIPFAVVVSFLFQPYERQYTYTLLTESTMFGANLTMFYLLSSTKSSYRQTSTDDVCLPQ